MSDASVIAAVGSLLAVAVSGTSVAVTVHFGRERELAKWRRQEERPLLASLLELGKEHRSNALPLAIDMDRTAKSEPPIRHPDGVSSMVKGAMTLIALRSQAEALRLVASDPVVKAANLFVMAHEDLQRALVGFKSDPEAKSEVSVYPLYREHVGYAEAAERALVDAGRQELQVHYQRFWVRPR